MNDNVTPIRQPTLANLVDAQRATGDAVIALHAQVAELTKAVQFMIGIVLVAAANEQNRQAAGSGQSAGTADDPPGTTRPGGHIPEEPK